MGYTYNQPTQVTMDNISAKWTAVEAKVVRLLGKYYIYTHRSIDTFQLWTRVDVCKSQVHY
jgi:hypothetical protein